MTSRIEREERVRQGSRRQRDLAAVEDPQQRREQTLAWAERVLPAEHGPFVVAAADALRAAGRKPTAEAIRARLVDQGRDHESLERLA